MADLIVPSYDVIRNAYTKYLKRRRVGLANCVFEGGDDHKFYSVKIRSLLNANIHPIILDGKSNVLGVYSELKSIKPKLLSDSFFFVDADFDDNSKYRDEEKVYITCRYSIESYYADLEFLSNLLSEGLYIRKDNRYHSIVLKDFSNEYAKYLDMIEIIQALKYEIKYQKLKEHEVGLLPVSQYVSIAEGEASLLSGSERKILDVCKKLNVSPDGVKERFRQFVAGRPKENVYRGKDAMLFVSEYVKWIVDIRKGKKAGENRLNLKKLGTKSDLNDEELRALSGEPEAVSLKDGSIHLNVDSGFIQNTSIYSIMPESLRAYIHHWGNSDRSLDA